MQSWSARRWQSQGLWIAVWSGLSVGCRPSENGPAPIPEAASGSGGAASLVLVVIDTLRADHLSLYGYERETSPRLDQFAEQATVFDRCYATSSWTQPSTVSLLTGLYPARHGAHEMAQVDANVEFLAEVLQQNGYATAGFSGNPNASPLFDMDQGFDEFFFSGNSLAREYPDATELLERADQWLNTLPAEQPFFLYLHLMNVHGPYRAPPEYRQRFLEGEFEEFLFQCELWVDILRKRELKRRQDVTDQHLVDLRARYDGAIAYTDEVLGDTLDRWSHEGQLDQSHVVITSDHGEELFDHGGFGHGWTLHGEVTQVPLLWRRPAGGGGGRRVAADVSLVDLPATALDVLGVAAAGALEFGDGVSFAGTLEGKTFDRGRPILMELKREKQGSALALQQWPYFWIGIERNYESKEPRQLLFQLEQDPDEQTNIAGQNPEQAQLMARTSRRLQQTLEAAGFQAGKVELDPKMQELLNALGYTDD